LKLPAESAGAFVTGATVANFTALAAARHAVLERVGWNVEANGLFGAPPITVIVGGEAHPSLIKALGMLGMGRARVTRVPVDDQGRMRADEIPPFNGPTILCIQAGNVNTGAFDPAVKISERAHQNGAWVHVDGAFGLWAFLRSMPRTLSKNAPYTIIETLTQKGHLLNWTLLAAVLGSDSARRAKHYVWTKRKD
jgi:glutamate/tyrosine decarboxylase-like PLP-dependent enzyme